MKKKLFSLVLVLALCLTSMQAMAVKRPQGAGAGEGGSGLNILPWGNFNAADDIKNMKSSGASAEFVDTGATNKGGALKVNVTAGWGYLYAEVPYVPGETYDISFYARIDGGTDSLEFIPMLGGSWDNSILIDTFTNEWKKYTCTYVCDGLAYNGASNTSNIRLFNTRRGPGNVTTTYYLDELVVSPRGNAEYDWSTFVKGGSSAAVVPADTGFATPQPVVEASFADTTGHWAETTINMLAASSYVQGMGDGTYAPEANVTRAQFVTMVMNLLRLDGAGYKGGFSDVKATDWFAKDLQNAVDIGLIDPLMTIGGKFRPNDAITREEAASILTKVAAMRKEKPETTVSEFSDDAAITNWTKSDVYDAAAYGLIKGYPNGSFGPKNNITRAESATMIYRTIELNSRFAVYVDGENGNDKNTGTVDAPLKTIDAARKMVRPYLAEMKNHIYVYIKEGRYVLARDVNFEVEDSGMNGYSVIYTSLGEEEPVISMGKDYGDFQLYDADKNIYRTYIGVGTITRQVYINGVRGVRARNEIKPDGILKNAERFEDEGYYLCDDVELASYQNQSDMEAVYFEQWTNPRARIESIEETADGRAKINMQKTSWSNAITTNTPASFPCYLENAYELLDVPGEWYLNKVDGYLYYMPREYEDPETMVAAVPVGERAMTIAGKNASNKIHNLKFNNLAFEYITWLYPSTGANAYRDGQGNHLATYEGDGRLTGGKEDAAVIVADAAYIDFSDCTFSKLGAAGINFREIFQNCSVTGSHFYDLSGSGLNIGIATEESDFGKYFKPTKYENYRINNVFNNNFIHDVGIDYLSSVGINISVGLKDSQVFHNEIYNVPYSGMHVGWGWASYAASGTGTHNLDINYNYIHDTSDSYVYDAGSVYLLGATGGSEGDLNELNYNYFENHRNSYAAIYPDEGSTYWEAAHNVIDLKEVEEWPRKTSPMAPRWLHIHVATIKYNHVHDNYSTTDEKLMNGPDNTIEEPMLYPDGEWPEEAREIINNAGLEAPYLEQYPDSVQRLRIMNKHKVYYLKTGESMEMEVVGYKRKLNEVQIPDSELNYYTTDSSIATIDETGKITATGPGRTAVYVEYLDGTVIRRKHFEVVVDDVVEEIITNVTALNILAGYEVSIAAEGKTRYGNTAPIDNATYTVADPEIASVTEDGKVVGLKKGETSIHAVYEADGIVIEKDYPVTVISYIFEDSDKYLETSTKFQKGHGFFNVSSWNHSAKAYDGGDGIVVSKTNSPAYYMNRIGNEVVSFDMTINPNGMGWPSFAIRNARPMEDYTSSDTYMMGFKADIIEVQRFNAGKRTMIFGDASFSPVGGPGYPNKKTDGSGALFEYGKRYSITVGALDEENGVRLVLLINDKPIFDFLDTADGHIKGEGLFGIYPGTGEFILQPYTGLTYEE